MAATMERLEEYKTHNSQFCKRLLDFLSIMFKFQAEQTVADKEKADKSGANARGGVKGSNNTGGQLPTIPEHSNMEQYLGQYSGLMLYIKEMDEDRYSKICAVRLRRWSVL